MSSDDLLDALPLEVLLALQELLGDPSEEGRQRAALRAADAGWHLELNPAASVSPTPAGAISRVDPEPIPMEPAPEGVESLVLRFDRDDRRR